MSETILVVEDERKIARLLQIELESEGYEVRLAPDGVEGWAAYKAGGVALILLDVMLPGIDGLELLRRIREVDCATPVLMLTAKSAVKEKVAGLDLGANDYVTKPFEMEELLARIRAFLRQTAPLAAQVAALHVQDEEPGEWLSASDLRLNESTREVERAGVPIAMTQREFDLLACLLRNKRLVLSRDQLLEEVWGYDYAGNTNVVDVYIRYVRKKVDEGFGAELIHTIRGIGYVIRDAT
ncbi:response regulator transcription factor [Paenibacillus sp. PAMC21692]|uniref:response regulator transcription factor n=1 Tax=Paenibacillus sp. PAMC21692 TaxID=2762320 RepID=UPI00164D8B26|nr:response regulator transcription factor [Paenibacillus sp. PAMC21692]QNK56139.1 response regulator transcription factor [Paenibacillus sp. PAMC21692]